MDKAVKEITGKNIHLQFKDTRIPQAELALSIRELYDVIVSQSSLLVREEAFYFLIEQLLEEHMVPVEASKELTETVKAMMEYLDTHYEQSVSLETLSEISAMSRYQLLRLFTREVGVSPYRYLQSIRIAKAKRLLEQGEAIGKLALDCGFSDQSHFTNYFKSFILSLIHIYVEDSGDEGDTYDYSWPAPDHIYTLHFQDAQAEWKHGALAETLVLHGAWQLPEALQERADGKCSQDIAYTLCIQLHQASDVLQCEMTIDNTAMEHRMRVILRGLSSSSCSIAAVSYTHLDVYKRQC